LLCLGVCLRSHAVTIITLSMRGLVLSLRIITLAAFARAQYSDQIVMDDPVVPMTRLQPSLADLLTVDQSVSIFYSYLRETEVSKALNDVQGSMTVFAPKNRAVMALAVKPCVAVQSTLWPLLSMSISQTPGSGESAGRYHDYRRAV
jgi:hypothetical protein